MADTDGDGLSDGQEDINGDGIVQVTESNPVTPDTDCDGLSDGAEVNQHNTRPYQADTDSDGLLDGVETGLTAAVASSNCSNVPVDVDPTTTTSPTQADSDNDGISDGDEDKNGNGRQDSGETAADDGDSDNDGLLDGNEPNEAAATNPGVPGGPVGEVNNNCTGDGLKAVTFNQGVSTSSWVIATEPTTAYKAITSNNSNYEVAALDDGDNAEGIAGFVVSMPLFSGGAGINNQLSALNARISNGASSQKLNLSRKNLGKSNCF